jgi:hypothetical protein
MTKPSTSDNICPDYHLQSGGFWERFLQKLVQPKKEKPNLKSGEDRGSTQATKSRAEALQGAIDYLQRHGFTVIKRQSGIWILNPIEREVRFMQPGEADWWNPKS